MVLYIAVFFSASALALSWLLLAENTPAHAWLLVHPAATNAAMAANLPAYFVAVLCSGNIHAPGTTWVVTAMVAQWFVIGLFVAWTWSRLRPNNSFKPKPLRGSA
jgi:hypothetical protein